MKKFSFLLGNWEMEYNIPRSSFSEATIGTGKGIFKKALDDKYVYFDYSTLIDGKKGQAHGIFARVKNQKHIDIGGLKVQEIFQQQLAILLMKKRYLSVGMIHY